MARLLRLLLACMAAIVVQGNCQGNCKNGKGVFTSADGQTYDGQWKDGMRSISSLL
jgi:hypothetical protein